MDWIDSFMAATSRLHSPEILRRWGAISAISGALERKVWVLSIGDPVYPNVYTVLVAPAAGGKTEIVKRVRRLWEGLGKHHVASSSVTKASFIDELNKGTRVVTNPKLNPATTTFNSCLFASSELGVLLPAYEAEFMATLTDLYDGQGYSETRRSMNEPIEIKSPHVCLLAACTPDYLRTTFPEGAWEQGFASRTFMIYNAEKMPITVDLEIEGQETVETDYKETYDDLQRELRKIGTLHGKMTFTLEAVNFIRRWKDSGLEPLPDHPRLIGYSGRRYLHFIKLGMISCVSATQGFLIDVPHLQRALDWMVEAEALMPEIFKAMKAGGDANVIKDTYHFIYTIYMKEKRPVHESRVWAYVQDQTSSHTVERIINSMERGGLIEKKLDKTGNVYVPRAKQY